MARLDTNQGDVTFDNLVIRAGDVGSIQLAADQGKLLKGSIIDNNGKLLDTATETVSVKYVVTSDTTYDAAKTYYTKSDNVYSKASISTFAEGTTYYEQITVDTVRKPYYILCDDTQTDDTATVTGIIYKNGNFVKEKLKVAENHTITAADIDDLRHVGIILESAN